MTTRIIFWDRKEAGEPEDFQKLAIASLPPEGLYVLARLGHITNRFELSQLVAPGQTLADEDLLLALYRRWGAKCAERIAGPFTWVVWDSTHRELAAARDRVGVYGLYYRVQGAEIRLAEEVESLLPAGALRLDEMNPQAVAAFLNGDPPLPSETFFKNIAAVQPGEVMVFHPQNITRWFYWQKQPQPLLKLASDAEYAGALRELLFRVIPGYVDDEPVGVTLSGGLDSSTVAGVIRAVRPSLPMRAISYVTPELPTADETSDIERAANFLNIPIVPVRGDLLWPLSSGEIRTYRYSPFTLYYPDLWEAVFEAARQQGIRCLMAGTGGDNLFGGSIFSYPDLLLTGKWLQLAKEVFAHRRASKKYSLVKILKYFLAKPIWQNTFLPNRTYHAAPEDWLTPSFKKIYREYQQSCIPVERARMLPARQMRFDELDLPFLSQIMEWLNVRGRAQGIQLVHPLMDHRLIDFALSLPVTQTARGPVRKVIVRNAMRGLLPEGTLSFYGKITPEAIFLRGVEREQEKIRSMLHHMRIAEVGIVDEKALQEGFSGLLNSQHQNGKFWFALSLEQWIRRCFSS